MPEFSCRVATLAGEVFERTYAAADEGALRRDLESQELMLLAARERNPFLRTFLRTFRFGGGVPMREFLFFNQELRALIKAGLPIVPSLDILLERRKNKVFRGALIDIRDRVKAGEALSDAFAAQGDMFPKLYPATLASGERSGELVEVISRFVAYMQNVLAVQRKVVSALVYPVVLISLSGVLVLVMIFFIIPKFEEFLTEFGTELPMLTKIVLAVSGFATQYWYAIFGGAIASLMLFTWWKKTEEGHLALDRFLLRLPVVGKVLQDYAQNRFTRTLGTLAAGGIPLVTSLELAAGAVGNKVFETRLLTVTERVREGKPLWESLDEIGLLSDIAIQMVKVGESTGAMDEMLAAASEFTDEEIDAQLTRMMALFEPVMLIAIAVVVALMLLSVYYPLIQLYGQTSA
jgi:type IV pilus assembly protein PilC